MPRFICYTDTKQHQSGEKSKLVFVNLDHVAQAIYDPEKEELQVAFVKATEGRSGGAVIRGDEATEALKVLREVT